jgi:hypothetical protein
MNKIKLIEIVLEKLIKIKCKITCCCKSTCSENNDKTEINYVDDNNNKKTIII